jgi:hypothetical protein
MAKTTKVRPWTKDDVRTLKTLAREKTKTTVIARKLKRDAGSHETASNETWCDAGGTSKETRSVKPILSAGRDWASDGKD